jgi:hypothetical protein
VFAGIDGAITVRPVIGLESAHALAELQSLVASSDTPEHRLAIGWLQREGRLDSANLIRCRGAFQRLLAAFGRGSPARAEQARSLFAAVVTRAPRGTGLPALLEEAVHALKSLNAQSG